MPPILVVCPVTEDLVPTGQRVAGLAPIPVRASLLGSRASGGVPLRRPLSLR